MDTAVFNDDDWDDPLFWKKIHQEYWLGFSKFFYKKINYNQDLVLREIYSESFVILYQKVTDRQIDRPLRVSLMTILIGIGKNVLKRYNDRRGGDGLDDLEGVEV